MIGSEQALGPFPLTARMYYSLFGTDHFGLQVRAMHLANLLDDLNPRRILDAGCSGGWYCFYLVRRYPSAEVVGVDLDASSLQNAEVIRHRLAEQGQRVIFCNTDLTRFRTDVPFDLICCIDMLEHVLDDERVLANLREALSDDGVLLLHVPQKTQLNRYLLPGFPVSEMSEGHVREYTEAEILSKLELSGFQIQGIRYTFGLTGSLAREIHYWLERIRLPFLRPASKAIMAPFLLFMSYVDTLTKNVNYHQGFFVRTAPIRVSRYTA